YDYIGHVLFTWNMPELWRRFTITLRRTLRRELRALGADPDAVQVSFIKVVELQARLVPHIHALIRLDPSDSDNCGGPE
ncbi:replication initiator, partial [Mycobacterium kansasii]